MTEVRWTPVLMLGERRGWGSMQGRSMKEHWKIAISKDSF